MKTLRIALLLTPISFLLTPLPSPAASPEAKPNFLFVIVDDQSPFDLKLYNPSSELDTPVIDSLAAQGMVLDGTPGSVEKLAAGPARVNFSRG